MTELKEINRLKLVTLTAPYDNWNNMLARDLFCQSVEVKLKGFGSHYPYGVMPVDTTDFIAHHHLVCREKKEGLEVLSSFKTVSLKKSQDHQMIFPGLNLVKLAGTNEHITAVENILEDVVKNNKELIYIASYTIHPKARKDKSLLSDLRDLFAAIYVLSTVDEGYDEILVGGTMRFKMHELFSKMGHEPLSLGNRELEPINVKHLAQEKVQVMHLKQFSKEAHAMAKPWQNLWNNRLVLEPSVEDYKISA